MGASHQLRDARVLDKVIIVLHGRAIAHVRKRALQSVSQAISTPNAVLVRSRVGTIQPGCSPRRGALLRIFMYSTASR